MVDSSSLQPLHTSNSGKVALMRVNLLSCKIKHSIPKYPSKGCKPCHPLHSPLRVRTLHPMLHHLSQRMAVESIRHRMVVHSMRKIMPLLEPQIKLSLHRLAQRSMELAYPSTINTFRPNTTSNSSISE